MDIHSLDLALLSVNHQWQILDFNQAAATLLDLAHEQGPPHCLFDLCQIADPGDKDSLFLSQAPGSSALVHLPSGARLNIIVSNQLTAHTSLILNSISHHPLPHLGELAELALQCGDIGVWQVDTTFENPYFSHTFCALLHCQPLTSWQDFTALIYEDDRPLALSFIEEHIQSNVRLKFEFRVLIDAVPHWFEFSGDQRRSSGTHLNLFGTLRECTQEKQMLIHLNNAHESRRIALEAGKVGTWCVSRQNAQWYWDWDPQTSAIFDLAAQDTGSYEKWLERIHPEDRARISNGLKEALESGEDFEHVFRAVLPNNNELHIFAKGVVAQDGYGNNYRLDGVCVDQSEVYRANMELSKLNAELETRVKARTSDLKCAVTKAERASRAKSDFLAMISHELRTPMNAIIGSLELLSLQKHDPEEMELLETASVSAKNLVDILNDILDINKIEAGKLELEFREFDISKTLHNVLLTFASNAEQRRVSLKVIESQQLPTMLYSDENRIRQVLFNLLSNAIKFSGPPAKVSGNVIIEVDWQVQSHSQGELSILVKDNGIGIDEKTQKKLFHPFTQADKSTTRVYGGTGLGLAISRKIIDLMGGRIGLKSKLERGSIFRVCIPIHRFSHHCTTTLFKHIYVTPVQHQIAESYPLSVLSSLTDQLHQVALDKLTSPIQANTLLCCLVQSEQDLAQLSKYQDILKEHRVLICHQTMYTEQLRQLLPDAAPVNVDLATRYGITRQVMHLLTHTAAQAVSTVSSAEPISKISSVAAPSATTPDLRPGILLVEDNTFNQNLMVKQLAKLGYTCTLAENGEQGFESWRKEEYKLILTDCHMPVVDGYEMAKRIRQTEKQLALKAIPIVAVTGAAVKNELENCHLYGINDCIGKPVQLERFKSVIEKWYGK
ncbi:PAS domain-containing hybrid sensor histidine kinase/response regulator [Pseudoalteromonas sp. OOF1S-7]|uniref:PAS domain-containing hybrid sensor histidine kinase/response regulator n=1 Tax=Pseudoalteromonas sp. OOF1S-7 TaxID=2917757 RepID=UPI001EF5D55B|nr:PAS domain-containing hybrid sensor histidine kinase/response regulator [Pseudoalteromonas sp. OOF1S-7]MCG7533844.1 ATP-binding protein [Pseudoalteromonas sp. OOF1S-7]